tara:strand:- start:112 stop:399 length:288 start_codon:yes stop_codon:yes gene_type:complete
MTTATFNTSEYGASFLRVNGRRYYVDRIRSLTKTGKARWEGTVDCGDLEKFKIEGGRISGGTSREWGFWLPGCEKKDKWLLATSFVQAIKIIDNP